MACSHGRLSVALPIAAFLGFTLGSTLMGGCVAAPPSAGAPPGPLSISLGPSARDGTLYFQVADDEAGVPIRFFRWRADRVDPIGASPTEVCVAGLCGPEEIPVVCRYTYTGHGRGDCRLVRPGQRPQVIFIGYGATQAVVSTVAPEVVVHTEEWGGRRKLRLFDVSGTPRQEACVDADGVEQALVVGDGTTVVLVGVDRSTHRIGTVEWGTGTIREIGLVKGYGPTLSAAPAAHGSEVLMWWSSEAQIAKGDWSFTLDRIDTGSGQRTTLLSGRVGGSGQTGVARLQHRYAFTRTIGPWTEADCDDPARQYDTVRTAVCVLDVRDGSVRQLTSGKWADNDPIAMAGDRIAYVRGPAGRQTIRVVRVDGTDDHEIWSLAQLDRSAP